MSSFELTDETLYQYEYVRRLGKCNMFNKRCVEEVADAFGFEELTSVIADGDYAKILEAYDPERASAVYDVSSQ